MTSPGPRPSRSDAPPLAQLLRGPLRVGLSAVALMTVTMTALALLLVADLTPRVARADTMLSALQDGNVAMVDQETGLRGFLVTREPAFLEPYVRGSATQRRLDAALRGKAQDDPAVRQQVIRLEQAENTWVREWAEPLLTSRPSITDVVALRALLLRGKSLFDAYRQVEAEVHATIEARRELATRQEQWTLAAGVVVALLLAGGAAGAVRRANRRLALEILPPTRRVRDALVDLADGDLDSVVLPVGPLELRDIADDVNLLGQALRERDSLVSAREAELVAARDGAERAGQAKTAFLATMSHEIRTPLNAVLGLTDLLLTTDLTPDQRSHLETISGSGDSLLALINDILDFSKIEAGELDLEEVPFDLHSLVYDVTQLLASQAAGKGLDLLVDIPADCPWQVVGDASRLRQVVMNLVGNALKFTSSGHVVVTVGGSVTGDRFACRIAVADTGIGIPANQRHRLFRSFSQVDTSTTRAHGGTGLGLAISQRIVRAMGGDIAVDSEEGVGSTFVVLVYLGVSHAGTRGVDGDQLAGRRILVVDDNSTNLRIMEHQLHQFGATSELVDSGVGALALLRGGERFDAALLDLHMPGMDGEDLAARMRERPAGADLPLVLLSSGMSSDPASVGLFAARLHKPVRPERLLYILQSVFSAGPDEAAVRGGGTRAAADGGGRRLRVLVAEDHDVNAHLMALYLDQLGHDCTHVPNGLLAVEAVRAGGHDVVLMDAQMPVLSGVDATAAIRALPGPQPRIIALTASVLASDRAAFFAAGADEFLTKPVRLATLDAALRSVARDVLTEVAAGTAEEVPPRSAEPLDAETVTDLRDLGEVRFQSLYRQYADSLDATVAQLIAVAAGPRPDVDDDASVSRLAHRLKGSSASMGALQVAHMCQTLEDAGRYEDVAEILAALERESRRVRAAVAALLD